MAVKRTPPRSEVGVPPPNGLQRPDRNGCPPLTPQPASEPQQPTSEPRSHANVAANQEAAARRQLQAARIVRKQEFVEEVKKLVEQYGFDLQADVTIREGKIVAFVTIVDVQRT